MDTARILAAWKRLPEAGRRNQRKQLGFALLEAGRRRGVPGRVADARARFECEARQALRDWLML